MLLGLACLAVYGWDDDYLLHGAAGAALLGLLAVKIVLVRRGPGRLLPYVGPLGVRPARADLGHLGAGGPRDRRSCSSRSS